ncbi:hypothetical protein GINT2_001495 [Glugoides intestinalis]
MLLLNCCIADLKTQSHLLILDDHIEISTHGSTRGSTHDSTHGSTHGSTPVYAKNIPFSRIKSVHVKNDDGCYLLKIKDDGDSCVLFFPTMHIRDMTKNILLDRIKLVEGISKSIINRTIENKSAFKNIKTFVSEAQYQTLVDRHESLFFQRSVEASSPETFFRTITQPLLDVFIKMNCSIEQFYNLLISSYFNDIKNKKNSLDRLLAEALRDGSPQLNYATRINTRSLLSLTEIHESHNEFKASKGKSVEFEPVCSVISPESNAHASAGNNSCEFRIKDLTASLLPVDNQEFLKIPFDPADFLAARDICRLVFLNKNERGIADSFSGTFLNSIEGKYGKEALKYVERLDPKFYASK